MKQIITLNPIDKTDIVNLVGKIILAFDLKLNLKDEVAKAYMAMLFDSLNEYNAQKNEIRLLEKRMIEKIEECKKRPSPALYIKYLLEVRNEKYLEEEEALIYEEKEKLAKERIVKERQREEWKKDPEKQEEWKSIQEKLNKFINKRK